MIVLFTDFGHADPYVGQLHAALERAAPGIARIDLMHEIAPFAIRPAAYLLASLVADFPEGTVFLTVVDPGVGSAPKALWVQADGRSFVGPDNGLLNPVYARARVRAATEVLWRPPSLSATFHGRDLFAPIAAALATGDRPSGRAITLDVADTPREIYEVIAIDRYGNIVTGLEATGRDGAALAVAGVRVEPATHYAAVPEGRVFCYANAQGWLECAANRARACDILGVTVGDEVIVL